MRTDPRIEEIETIDDLGRTSYMVHLKAGYRLEDAHSFGADNKPEIKATMARVKPCACADCLAVR